ncbi:hypothetical protein [Armatimonas rosea]|uniref:Uncharacterized protein n=1 Tax=Armatimonas rosea TaxID=685828 RepID=A0A7W9W4B2_ARMRO|nr:hypothetical protein [Armatimonas rosea]MBB6048333.1 hypothetical protein [Armatimonas rosea]
MQKPQPFIVHEWGTFLAIAGSNGVTLEGMSHEEHPLPDFVHAAKADSVFPKWPTLKGETPVIYFYTDKPRKVLVGVDFPSGAWTHWFPSAASAGRFSGSAPNTNGHLGWITQLAPPSPTDSLPELAADSLWRFARQVPAAATVTSNGEVERFLFYRGLGKANLPVELFPEKNAGRLVAHVPVQRVILLNIEQGKLTWRPVIALKAGQILDGVRTGLRPGSVEEIALYLTRGLIQSGLFPDEARALVNTWRSSYFEHDGFRVLFILPQAWTDRFIPLHVRPQPDQLVRVMVGRIEGLTKKREALVRAALLGFASNPEKHFATLAAQGRYLEPILRRLAQTPSLKPLCERFLATELVTKGRSDARALAEQLRLGV